MWHIALEGLPASGVCYGYKVNGDGGYETGLRWHPNRVLIDPYAPLMSGRRHFGKREPIEHFKAMVGGKERGPRRRATEIVPCCFCCCSGREPVPGHL